MELFNKITIATLNISKYKKNHNIERQTDALLMAKSHNNSI